MLRARETISDRERYSLSAAALDVLGEIDAGAVVSFLDSLPSGYDRSVLLTRLVTEAAAVAPQAAEPRHQVGLGPFMHDNHVGALNGGFVRLKP